jgi:hypothetical protein
MKNKDLYTFGKSPAAMYLLHLLQSSDDSRSFRIISKIISNERKIINSLVYSHYEGALDYKTFCSIIMRMKDNLGTQLEKNTIEPFYNNLVNNILQAEYKQIINKCQSFYPTAKRMMNKQEYPILPNNYISPLEATDASRTKKSAEYLARKGKVNTLYALKND